LNSVSFFDGCKTNRLFLISSLLNCAYKRHNFRISMDTFIHIA
jgi:hypothetical protein